MDGLRRGFRFQLENSKKEIGLQFGVVLLFGAILLPILNLILLPKELILAEKWVKLVLRIYESFVLIAIIELINISYFNEFPMIIKLGITRNSFWIINLLSLFIRIVAFSLSYMLLGKIIAFYFKVLDLSHLLTGDFIQIFFYDLVNDSIIILFIKIFYVILLISPIINILGIVCYKRGFRYITFFLTSVILTFLIILGFKVQGSILYSFQNSSLLVQGLISIIVYLLGGVLSKYFINKLDILN